MAAARDLLDRLLERRDLTQPEAEELLAVLTDPATSPAFGGAVLAAMRSKGVVADEVRGFAQRAGRPFQPGCPPSTSSVPEETARAASTSPPARHSSLPPAACR